MTDLSLLLPSVLLNCFLFQNWLRNHLSKWLYQSLQLCREGWRRRKWLKPGANQPSHVIAAGLQPAPPESTPWRVSLYSAHSRLGPGFSQWYHTHPQNITRWNRWRKRCTFWRANFASSSFIKRHEQHDRSLCNNHRFFYQDWITLVLWENAGVCAAGFESGIPQHVSPACQLCEMINPDIF